MKKNLLFILAILVITGGLAAGFFILTQKKGPTPTIDLNKIVLYYSDTCPHCLVVNKYLEENKVAEKMSFEHLEVGKNQDNAKLLMESAKACGVKSQEVGVPFLQAEGKCLSGDKDIIEFFKNKIGQ